MLLRYDGCLPTNVFARPKHLDTKVERTVVVLGHCFPFPSLAGYYFNCFYFGAFQILISYGADITMQDKRRRNVLHFLADAYCIDGCDAVLEQVLYYGFPRVP